MPGITVLVNGAAYLVTLADGPDVRGPLAPSSRVGPDEAGARADMAIFKVPDGTP